jgi:hypothetical protein
VETYGQCAGRGVDRLTPGLAPDGGRLCTDCAGGLGDFFCQRCGQEALLYQSGTCGNCVLAGRLRELLDDGTGQVRAELAPLLDLLRGMKRPRSGITWIRELHVQRNLRALARGEVPLTHDGLSTLSPWRSVAYLRDLLMQVGVLPHVDRHLVLFQRWLTDWLPTIDDQHRKLVERFVTWHVLRKLRDTAARRPIGTHRQSMARDTLVQAAAFLAWLASRGRTVSCCTQADLDAWFAEGRVARRPAQSFLRWCMDNRRMPRLTIPVQRTENPAPITRQHRITLIRQILTGSDLPLVDRVVALLVLLYAQPVSRLVMLTTDDILHDGDEILIRLGDPPSPVPEPFASLLLAHLDARPNTSTATNPASNWLFPGRRAGQPMNPAGLQQRLRRIGIPGVNGRTSAIRQLLLEDPAPIVARMLGYHEVHAELIAGQAGALWKSYAPGNHTRSPVHPNTYRTRDS